MKKKCIRDAIQFCIQTKVWRIMRISVFLLLVCISQGWAVSGYSQQTRISLKMDNTRIVDVLDEIEDKSEFYFLFSRELVNVDTKININLEKKTIEEILSEILTDTDINYQIENRQIVLSPSGVASIQQQKNVSGSVVDSSGAPLPGVSIVVKGTTTGTITDFDGNFNLANVTGDAMLVFSFVGMKTQELEVAGQTSFKIVMEEDAIGIDEVVAVGYGSVRKRDLTGSVASVKAETIARTATTNVTQALQGAMPGVTVTNTSGAPGSSASILIRGQGSFSNTSPLIVVDGLIGSGLANIDPSDIESLEVLKDASSAAIYGSRAANGVILITTKRGESGETKISFTTSYGIQDIANPLDLINAKDWRDRVVLGYQADNREIPEKLQNGVFDPTNSTDWQDVMFKTAMQKKYNLNFSGGGEKSNFSFSVGYVDQEGTAVETYYNRLNIRLNSDFEKGILKFGESVSLSRERANGGVPLTIRGWPAPVFKAKNEDGTYGGWVDGYGIGSPQFLIGNNPLAERELMDNTSSSIKILTNVYATVDILKGLQFKTSFSIDATSWGSKNFTPAYNVGNGISTNPTADLNESRGLSYSYLTENTLNYTKKIGKHRFSILAGWTRQFSDANNLRVIGEKFPIGITSADAAQTILPSSGGSVVKSSLESVLSRVNYSYADKYLLTASIRRDGSSRFREDLRWGSFPSFSVGWILTEESFFPQTTFIDYLKLRGGYGELGSQNAVSQYQIQNVLALGGNGIDYVLGDTQALANGVTTNRIVNTGLLWETASSSNIGLEAKLFDSKVDFTVEYFKKNTQQLQFSSPIPRHLGYGDKSSVLVNAGDIQNKGVEFTLEYHKRDGEFKYDIMANVFTLETKVLSLNNEDDILYGGQVQVSGTNVNKTEVGKSLANFWLYQHDGLFQSLEEVQAHSKDGNLIQPNAQPGDVRYIDTNDDGVVNDEDRIYFDGNMPDFEYGLNFNASYKNFDLNLMLQGTVGNKILNGVKFNIGGSLAASTDYWSEDNRNAEYSRPVSIDANINNRLSDWLLEDASYLRVKSLQIGYTLPGNLLSKINVKQLRFSVTAENYLTFTNFSGYDPENNSFGINRGVNSTIYPLPKTILFGLNVNF